jgi:hypothetical protein
LPSKARLEAGPFDVAKQFAAKVDYSPCACVEQVLTSTQETSMKKTILAALFSLAFAGSALASQCPGLMAKIDEAMKTATLDDATKAKVMELYTKGKADHEAGKHAESEASLGEAMKMMGI